MDVEEKTKEQLIAELAETEAYIAELIAERTEYTRLEKALRESEAHYRAIVEAFDGLIYICSSDYRIRFMNKRLIERTGYDATGELCYRVLHDRDAVCLWCVNERVFRGETVRWEVKSPKDNHWYYVVNTPIYHTDGTISKQAMILDITDIKIAEENLKHLSEDLKRSNEALRDFAYVASHDLKKPLMSVESFARLLARKYRNQLDEKGRDLIDYIVSGVNRMQLLIHDLLEYAQIDLKEKQYIPVDSALTVQEAMKNLQAALTENDAEVVCHSLPTVMGDVPQLVSLFQNLIDNAVKFRSNRSPKIEISAKRRGGKWVFAIRDNGIGIAPKEHERIFGMFQRLHGTSEYEGTGIGLALCKKIIECFEGSIWVKSEPGKGSTFFFTLPAVNDSPGSSH